MSDDLRSVYADSYRLPPRSAMTFPRFAVAPRIVSSTKHAPDYLCKDLDLKAQRDLQVPDHGVKIITEAPLVDPAC